MPAFLPKHLPVLILFLALLGAPISEAASRGNVITLENAYDRTLASDQSIQIAWLEIRKASLEPLSALTRITPRISANLGYDSTGATGRQTGLIPITSSRSVTTRTDVRSAGFSYSQTLMDFSVFPAWRLGKLTEKSSKLEYSFTVRETLFGVARAYYNVLKQQSIVAVNQQTLDLAAGQLDQAQKRFDVGQAARTDVLRAQATQEDARRALIESQTALSTARNVLVNILNLGKDTGFELREPTSAAMDKESFDDALSQAYARREDYQVSVIAIKQDIERHNEVRAQYLPKLVADVSQNWNGYNGADRNNSIWEASLALQIPIFTGGQREIDMATSRYQIDETRLNHDKLTKSIQEEVKNAYLATRTLVETIKALQAEVAAADQNYKDLDVQYRVGAATSLDVQTALRDLNNSRTILTGQIYDNQVALRDLQRSEAAFQSMRVSRATERFAPSKASSKDKRR
jgi:outer membrane protein